MSADLDHEPTQEDRQDLRENDRDDTGSPTPKTLADALVTKKPGIKPS
jgi:hypothetical protein